MTNDKAKVVELNPYEVAAYWWVKRLKHLSDEFNQNNESVGIAKREFGRIFNYEQLKNSGYRKIYLGLAEKFEQACQHKRRYSVRTHKLNNGHLDLNEWLSQIMEEEVPNINLCEKDAKDTIMIISLLKGDNCVYVGDVDFNGIKTRLPSKYKANSILCGVKNKGLSEEGEPENN